MPIRRLGPMKPTRVVFASSEQVTADFSTVDFNPANVPLIVRNRVRTTPNVRGGWGSIQTVLTSVAGGGAAIFVPALNINPPVVAGGALVVGTTYFFVLTANGGAGSTSRSNEVNAVPTAGNQTVSLSWTPIVGATGYSLFRSTVSGTYGANSLVATIGGGATATFNDVGNALLAGQPAQTNTASPAFKFNPLDVGINQLVLTAVEKLDIGGGNFKRKSVTYRSAVFEIIP